jgi:uncharacterized membrane protein YiaA
MKFFKMKNLQLLLMIVAIFFALYEQSKPQPNKIFMTIAILLFMFGLMKLMKKIPSKDEDQDEQQL